MSERRTQAERRASAQERVLDAAAELVGERGLRGLTLAAVGARAGFSRGITTHHFGSRRALLDALAGHLQDRFEPPAIDDRSGHDALLHVIDAYLIHRDATSVTSRAFLILWAEAFASEPALAPVFAERDARFRSALVARIAAGVDDGSIRSDVDAEALSYVVVGALRGVGLQVLLADRPPGTDRFRTEIRALLGGAAARG